MFKKYCELLNFYEVILNIVYKYNNVFKLLFNNNKKTKINLIKI